MKRTYIQSATAAAALLALVLLLPLGRAGATDGAGVSTTILSRGTTLDEIRLRTERPSEFVFARVTLQPGGYTGWHTHPGPLLVVVASGTLTRYDAECDACTYTAGQAFIESAGRRHVHMGANKTRAPVVLDITYVVPAGGSLRDEAVAPKCAAGLSAGRPLAAEGAPARPHENPRRCGGSRVEDRLELSAMRREPGASAPGPSLALGGMRGGFSPGLGTTRRGDEYIGVGSPAWARHRGQFRIARYGARMRMVRRHRGQLR